MTYERIEEKLALALRVWADFEDIQELKTMNVSEALAKDIIYLFEEWGYEIGEG